MTQTATAPASAPSPTTSSNAVMNHRQILLVIYGLMGGMFLGALDQTVVGTAIRTIGDDLHGLNEQAWVTTAYLIASTIMTPIYGKLSDIFGRRPLFITAIGIFIVGSLLASMSTSMLMLAAFRGVQGLGAGGLMSLPLAIMGDMLAPRERAKYQGYFLAVFGISSVIGPLVGGLFAGANQILFLSGWRWVFLINVPVGIIALIMVMSFLHLPKVADRASKPRIDWWGAALVVVTLVPLLLIAEQGRDWGWTSVGAWACYITGAVGLVLFIFVERAMRDDAIIPLKLFGSGVFSMTTILSVLVGFGMFGAMLTIPLYLQIVKGVTPTESGFSMLPMVLGLMIASIGSGQIIARTGKYRIFPLTGTAVTSIGFVLLTFITADRPLWFLMVAMFCIGLGLGQLMQTLTLAAQNSVAPRDIGVATSAATFFRSIGGTLGTAILLSVLFTLLPTNIVSAYQNKSDLTAGLNAALTPSVANASENKQVMSKMWDNFVRPLKSNIDKGLQSAASETKAAVTKQVTVGVQKEVAAGALPASQEQAAISAGVTDALPSALKTTASKAHASVDGDSLTVDWSNASQRKYWVDQTVPAVIKKLDGNSTSTASSSNADTSDTSFLNGANPNLTRPFLVGFSNSAVKVYWVGLGVLLLAFVLTWFFKVPPLRKVSGLQEQADASRAAAAASAAGPEPAMPRIDDADGSRTTPVSPDVQVAVIDHGETRAPLPDAPTHGAHSAAVAVDSPSEVHAQGAPKHAAGAPSPAESEAPSAASHGGEQVAGESAAGGSHHGKHSAD